MTETKQPVYFDYAAASPLDDDVFAAMQPYFSQKFYNPSALYLQSKEVADDIKAARESIAKILGARPTEIIFTAGGSEANNLAIRGLMERFPNGEVLVSSIEHDSVLKTTQQFDCKLIPVKPNGIVDPSKVESLITDRTVLVSLMYANNEIGTIQPIKEVAEIISKIRSQRQARGLKTPIYLHTDACQAANYLDLHVSRLGVDLMTINGGKIYGPKQTGLLFVKAGIELKPLIYGGGQEYGLRSGTENPAGIVGLATALEKAQALRAAEVERLKKLQTELINQLEAKLPGAQINGSLKKRLPNNLHVTFEGQDNERLLIELEMQGLITAAGSACSASNDEPSHVLNAIGLTDQQARASLRFSMGRQTTQEQINQLASALVKILQQ